MSRGRGTLQYERVLLRELLHQTACGRPQSLQRCAAWRRNLDIMLQGTSEPGKLFSQLSCRRGTLNIKPDFPALARLLRFAAVPSPPSRPSSLFRTTTSHRLVALMFFPILVSQSAATSVGQNLKSADLECFVGLFMRLAESMPALRSSIPDFYCFGETYSNMVVDFKVSVQKEDRNSTSPNSIPAEKIERFRLIF